VVGVSSETIQPPHPIFGDINVKYIHGVVENQGRLYIILDIAKIFAPREERKAEDARALSGVETAPGAVAMAAAAQAGPADEAGMDLAFIRETLATFRRFGDSPINREWTAARFSSWKTARKGKDLQLKEAADADAFLEGFLSPHTAELWGREYLEDFIASLPDLSTKSVSAWNLGCGRGFETYSLAVALRRRYPEARIKVWANDADLLNISMAPNMVIQPGEAPEVYREYLQPGRNGLVFTAAIRDSISFEYHDVLNANPVPEVDLIVCRDTLSFMTADEQSRILADFRDKLKPGGRVFLGANEDLSGLEGWKAAPNAKLRCFTAED
jgi:purine-binding chemotaxis protein CheW